MQIGLFSHTDLPGRINLVHVLSHQCFNLRQLFDNLFKLGFLGGYLKPSTFLIKGFTTSLGEAYFTMLPIVILNIAIDYTSL